MNFRIGSIPIRIHATFFITALFLQAGVVMNDHPPLGRLVGWVVVVLVSVILHELGHAFAGKAFGLAPEIDLHGMGGTTSWRQGRDVGAAKSVVISLAGPTVGLVVGGALWLTAPLWLGGKSEFVHQIANDAFYVNFLWGLFNLVPMFPLDGGNAVRSILVASLKKRGAVISHVSSIVVAVVTGAGAYLLFGNWWVSLLALMFAAQNWRVLQALRAVAPPPSPPAPYGV